MQFVILLMNKNESIRKNLLSVILKIHINGIKKHWMIKVEPNQFIYFLEQSYT